MKIPCNKTSEIYGRLTVVEKFGTKPYHWKCLCVCGNLVEISKYRLKDGHTRSCGCLKKENKFGYKHGLVNTKLYNTWRGMKDRCLNVNNSHYRCYGERGIGICKDWLEFKFFCDWALANGYKDGLTIERIDVDKGYNPNNCTWIPHNEQSQNTTATYKIAYKGKTQNLTQWCKDLQLPYITIRQRIKCYGWDIGKAFETPIKQK